MDKLTEQRVGVATDKVLEKLQQSRPQDYEKILTGLQSEYAQRKAAGYAMLNPLDKNFLSSEGKAVAADLGPEDFLKLLEEYGKLQQPALTNQEQTLITERARLIRQRASLEREIAELKDSVARYNDRLKTEQGTLERLVSEGAELQRELAAYATELEEATAARNLAHGRANDVKEQLRRLEEQYQQLVQQAQALVNEVRQRELQSARGRGE
jgi:hypothetical protein